jgi:hypothetical protein
LYTIKGDDGGPQALGQFYNPEIAQRLADFLNGEVKKDGKIKAFVSPCKEVDNDCVRCKNEEAEFYGMYLKNFDGENFHISDFRHADEALSAAASLNLFYGHVIKDEWDQMEEG